jgi:UDP-N-acetylmuramate: L-alanyl-gamma-D-glutamyl-meso-diaminopimelate ligase
MASADYPVVYFSHHALALKRLPELTSEDVRMAFDDPRLIVYNDSVKMQEDLLKFNYSGKNLLLMSSGNFDGLDLDGFAERVVKK